MKQTCNRALKEWAVACDALRDGRMTLLIRKGGIREDNGVFEVSDREFFLLPTFEHQVASLLQPDILPKLEDRKSPPTPDKVLIDTFAVVDCVVVAKEEAKVNAVADECLWNSEYVKMRFDFNPYDPLYLLLLRAYRLPDPVELALLPEYVGCRSWVTLDRELSTDGAIPALCDAEYTHRKERVLSMLGG